MPAKFTDILSMYVEWAAFDLKTGIELPKKLIAELKSYGQKKSDFFDQRNAIVVMQQVEDDGFTDDSRFEETARRIGRFRAGHPDARKVQEWWKKRKGANVSHLVDDRISRKGGRPKKTRKKAS